MLGCSILDIGLRCDQVPGKGFADECSVMQGVGVEEVAMVVGMRNTFFLSIYFLSFLNDRVISVYDVASTIKAVVLGVEYK